MKGRYWFGSCILILSVIILVLVLIILTINGKDKFASEMYISDPVSGELDIPDDTWAIRMDPRENQTMYRLPPAESTHTCVPKYLDGDVPEFYTQKIADRNNPRRGLFEDFSV